uniref:hypothetical protein n=1 Tax=uncultured Clostridium sp. TaxID=59620 RepID=UPI003216EF28
MSAIKRALRYMTDKNFNPIPEYMNSMPEKGKDLEVHPKGEAPKGGIGSTLIPCKCPQDFGQVAVIDATTKGRIVKFSIKVNNLCRNKEYIVSVVLYKWVWVWHCKWVKVPIAEDFKIAKYTGCESHGTDTVYFQLAIKEPLCSGQCIGVDIISNYVNDCNLQFKNTVK